MVCPRVHLATGEASPAEWSLTEEVQSDAQLQSLATDVLSEQGIRSHLGDALTVSRVMSASSVKAEIGHALRVKVVDMESFWVARRAVNRVGALLVVRAISDPIDYSLPDLTGVMDAGWNVRPMRVVAALVRRPSLVVTLTALAHHARRAARSLGAFVPALVGRL